MIRLGEKLFGNIQGIGALYTTRMRAACREGVNFLLKEIVPCFHVFVLLENIYLPYSGTLQQVISVVFKTVIGYPKNYILELLHVKYHLIMLNRESSMLL